MSSSQVKNDPSVLINRPYSFSDETLSSTVESVQVIDMAAYNAKNVSNDHEFTKEYYPSASPTISTSAPTISTSAPTISTSAPTISTSAPTISTSAPTISSISSSAPPTSSPIATTTTFLTRVKSGSPSSSPSATPKLPFSSSPSSEMILSGIVESCPGITNEIISNELSKYEAFFDYEIVTEIENASMEDILGVLEERVLEDVASKVLNCGGNRRKTNVKKGNRKLQNHSPVVRIDSAPADTVDNLNVECIRDTGVSDEGDLKCTPINGAMSFYIDCQAGTDCEFPDDEILTTIEAGCEDGLYVDGDLIKQVNFIGTRELSPILAVQLSNENKKKSDLGVGLSLGVIALVAVVVAIVSKRRSKPKFMKAPLSEANDSYSQTYDFSEGFSEQSSSFESDLDSNKNLVSFHQIHTEIDDEGQVTVMPRMDSSINWAS